MSLLINDIQSFANLYKDFRDRNSEFFDIGASELDRESVPVVPELSSAFYMLGLIDEYR